MTRIANRRFVSLTTWFFQPEMGMTRYEVLSRASACAVRMPTTAQSNDRRWTFLTSQHVTHPFRYPQYYAEEQHAFVHMLTEADVRCTVEVRSERTGAPLAVGHLDRFILGSSRRDVAVVQFPDLESQASFLSTAATVGCHLEELELGETLPPEGSALTFEGHILQPIAAHDGDKAGQHGHGQVFHDDPYGVGLGPGDEDGQTLVPRTVHGKVLARSQRQVFAKTNPVLEMGMCGGPVLDGQGHCVGVVEGIVPTQASGSSPNNSSNPSPAVSDKTRALLAGCASFVETPELKVLLEEANDREKKRMR